MKELPTFKDVDFRNNMQKVYVTEEDKEKFVEKVNRDVEVGWLQCLLFGRAVAVAAAAAAARTTGWCHGNRVFGVCKHSSW